MVLCRPLVVCLLQREQGVGAGDYQGIDPLQTGKAATCVRHRRASNWLVRVGTLGSAIRSQVPTYCLRRDRVEEQVRVGNAGKWPLGLPSLTRVPPYIVENLSTWSRSGSKTAEALGSLFHLCGAN